MAEPASMGLADGGLPHLAPALAVLSGGMSERLHLVRQSSGHGPALERYAVVPRFGDPRALLPIDAGPAALAAALAQHAAGAAHPLARAAAAVLGVASRFGLAVPLLRHRAAIIDGGLGLQETPLHGFLSDIVGRTDFVTALRLAPGRPNSKPVVQAVARDGKVLAYAKFGWDDVTRRLVAREADVLRDLEPLCRGTALAIPPLLFSGAWSGFEVLVVAPLGGGRRVAALPVAACKALASVRPPCEAPLAKMALWQRMGAQAARAMTRFDHRTANVIARAMSLVVSRWGDVAMNIGQSHGDFIPPNLSRLPDGRFALWDWERGEPDVPFGLDTTQFLVFGAMRRRSNAFTGGAVLGKITAALSTLGQNPSHAHPLLVISLLRSLLWFGEALEGGKDGQVDERFVSALAAVTA